MPAAYAHYLFGQQVRNQLSCNLKKLIADNLHLYQIGLHGPDIFFYYKPLSSNLIKKTGSDLHQEKAESFLAKARKIIGRALHPEASLAYILGFICHFMLDSECHPQVNELMRTTGLSHYEIETEFERSLMIINGIDPLRYQPTGHIIPNYSVAQCIAQFYPGLTSKEVFLSLKSMRLYLNLLSDLRFWPRTFLTAALKLSGNYQKLKGLLMTKENNPLIKEGCDELAELMEAAIMPTAILIEEFQSKLQNEAPLSEHFMRSFD